MTSVYPATRIYNTYKVLLKSTSVTFVPSSGPDLSSAVSTRISPNVSAGKAAENRLVLQIFEPAPGVRV